MYDPNNVFAQIIQGHLPAKKVYEDDYVFAFDDIHPQAQTHVLVIPKGEYCSFDDFSSKASSEEIAAFMKAVVHVAHKLGLDKTGYRLVSNVGKDANQLVNHFHMHIFGSEPLGPSLPSAKDRC